MFHTRILCISGLLAGVTILLQVVPGMLGQPYVFISLLSGLPIYMISKMSLLLGFAVYGTVGIIIVMISMPEGILFLFINGIIGLSLGILSRIIANKAVISIFTAILITSMLFLLNYVLGIHIFDYTILKSPIVQAISLFCLLLPGCLVYLNAASHLYALFGKNIYIR